MHTLRWYDQEERRNWAWRMRELSRLGMREGFLAEEGMISLTCEGRNDISKADKK